MPEKEVRLMDEGIRGPSRKGFLTRGLAMLAGALGLGAAGAAEAGAATPRSLTLYGRLLHLHAPQRRAGVPPAKGERFTAYAELLDRPGGRKVGEFSSALFALGPPAAVGSLELHSFNLEDGTILGLGTAAKHGDGTFAIVGGTGRFAGASGTYTAELRPRELGGNGAAVFRLSLVN
jgi:hypothetical protein